MLESLFFGREMHSLEDERLPEYNTSILATTTGFEQVSDSVSSSDSTVYSGAYNSTNVTVLVSVSSSGSSVSNVAPPNAGSSADILTRVTVSCVTCVAILLILIPLVIWRCRMCQKVTISSPSADKYGIFCSCLNCASHRLSCLHLHLSQ